MCRFRRDYYYVFVAGIFFMLSHIFSVLSRLIVAWGLILVQHFASSLLLLSLGVYYGIVMAAALNWDDFNFGNYHVSTYYNFDIYNNDMTATGQIVSSWNLFIRSDFHTQFVIVVAVFMMCGLK